MAMGRAQDLPLCRGIAKPALAGYLAGCLGLHLEEYLAMYLVKYLLVFLLTNFPNGPGSWRK